MVRTEGGDFTGMAVAKNLKLRIFWPDIFMHEECHKVQEKHSKKIENYRTVLFDSSNQVS